MIDGQCYSDHNIASEGNWFLELLQIPNPWMLKSHI